MTSFGGKKAKILSHKRGLKTKPQRNLIKNYFSLQNYMAFHTFYPNLPIFLHRYICHICDILQLCKNPKKNLQNPEKSIKSLILSRWGWKGDTR